jgi:hypothetical protein
MVIMLAVSELSSMVSMVSIVWLEKAGCEMATVRGGLLASRNLASTSICKTGARQNQREDAVFKHPVRLVLNVTQMIVHRVL